MRERWDLQLAAPFTSGGAAFTAPGRTGDGVDVVLKLQFPHRECAGEARALRCWNGVGAVRLLDHVEAEDALLLERCLPGAPLSGESPERALDVLVDLLPQLCIETTVEFPRLGDEARLWIDALEAERTTGRRGVEPDLVASGIERLEWLTTTAPQDAEVLLHQDLHGENVISNEGAWLAIDPKPLIGDAAFAVAPIVRSPELGHGREQVRDRFERMTEAIGVDRERARSWTIGQSLALALWLDDAALRQRFVDVAAWLRA